MILDDMFSLCVMEALDERAFTTMNLIKRCLLAETSEEIDSILPDEVIKQYYPQDGFVVRGKIKELKGLK